ncbi:MAG: hypothetical protein AAB421_04685 [Patescibacteria group bacterium]
MKKYLPWVAGLVGIVVLLSWGRLNPPQDIFWKDTKIACLPNGHANLALHIHPDLQILVDGVAEKVPAHIGDTPSCMTEVHTHDDTGKIHAEATTANKTFTLADFFAVWGTSIERPGYTLTATIDGTPETNPSALTLKDGQKIVLAYTKTIDTSLIAPQN